MKKLMLSLAMVMSLVSTSAVAFTQTSKIPDMNLKVSGDVTIDLSNYFTSTSSISYVASELTGSLCLDDDSYNDCFTYETISSGQLLYIAQGQSTVQASNLMLITASSNGVTLTDTVDMKFVIDSVLAYSPIPEQTANFSVQSSIDLNSYYSNNSYTFSYNVTRLSGAVCLNDYSTTSSSCYSSALVSGTEKLYFKGQTGSADTSLVQVVATTAIGSRIDTFVVVADSNVVLVNAITDRTMSTGVNTISLPLSSYINGYNITYSASSKGIVRDTIIGTYLYLYREPNKFGTDTVVVTGTNSKNSISETFAVAVAKVDTTVYTTIPTQTVNYRAQTKIDLRSYYSNPSISLSYTVSSLNSGGVCVEDYSTTSTSCYSSASVNSSEYLYLAGGNYTKDTSYIQISTNSGYGTRYDTVKVVLDSSIVKKSDIPNQSMTASYSVKSLNLSSYFSGYNLTYSATTSGITKDSISGYYLYNYRIANKSGVDTVIVSASNSKSIVKDTFLLSVAYVDPKPTQSSKISDKTLNFGYTNNGSYNSYFSSLEDITYTLSTVNGTVKPVLAVNSLGEQTGYFYIDSVNGVWGTDTLIMTATNSFGSNADTFEVEVLNPTPQISYPISNLTLSYGSDAYRVSTGINGSGLVYSVQSTNNAMTARMGQGSYSSYIYLDSVDGKWGRDTIIVSASNNYGTVKDTFTVNVTNYTADIKLSQVIPTQMISAYKTNHSLILSDYFENASGYRVTILSGDVCIDDDASNNCYTSDTFYSNEGLYLEYDGFENAQISIEAYNTADTMTAVVEVSFDKTPLSTGTIMDTVVMKHDETAIAFSSNFVGATSYSAKSLNGLTALAQLGSSSDFTAVRLGDKSGLEMVEVTATNSFGTTTDTIYIEVASNVIQPVLQGNMANWDLNSSVEGVFVNGQGQFDLAIYSLSGQRVFSTKSSVEGSKLVRMNLTSGRYMMVLKTQDGVMTEGFKK